MKPNDIVDGNNYISINKLFKACCYMHDRYVNAYDYLRTSFYLKNNSVIDYSIDHYNYDEDFLVLAAHFPFTSFKNNYYYLGLNDGCVVPVEEPEEQEKKEAYDDIISKYCEEITESIAILKKFKNYRTSTCKNVKVIGSPYLLDVDSFGIALSLDSDEKNTFRVEKSYYFLSDDDYKSNSAKAIDDFVSNKRKILHNSYVNISDLPEWCVEAINDYSNRGLLGKVRKKFNKMTVSSDVIEKLKEAEKNEKSKKKKLNLIIKDIGELIDKANSLNSVDDYERINLEDYSILFEKKRDHLEIKKVFIPFLKYIDLSLIPFDNVYVSGIDFTDTNVTFNPQKVYKKDLSFCTFGDVDRKENNIPFSISTDFNGVDLRGTVINDCHADFRYNLSGAITDEKTSITYSIIYEDDNNKEYLKRKDM